MQGLIPENLLEDILNRVDIVEVISGYLPLKRAGRNFKANCPFHHEKTPSFMVSPDRQIYHCFGCGESGNAYKFLMRYERLEFPEAVEVLAKKAGVTLPESNKQDEKKANLTTSLFKINELTASFYSSYLDSASGIKARNYLLERGLKDETIKSFKLGLGPDSWDALINHLRSKSISISLLEKAGLVIAKDGGGYYDRFRNRIIFPIFDIKNRPIAFGARVLDDTLPKYLNSPETPIYTKGKNLFGLNLAKDSIRDMDSVIIVEGYLDMIMPYQEGLSNIVASLGTALTSDQARLIKRYTQNVIVVYDADAAGEMATIRSLDIFIEEEMNVKVVSLPKGFDPDTFVRKNGIKSLEEKILQAKNLFDYKLHILKSRFGCEEIEDKVKIARSMLETINKIKNEVLKSEYVKKLSQELDLREDALLSEMKKIKEPSAAAASVAQPAKKTFKINPTEQLLIKMMLEENELIHRLKESLEPADFQDERACRIVSILFDLAGQGKDIGPRHLMNHFPEEEITQVLCESVFMPEDMTGQHREKVIEDCVKRLKNEKLKTKKNHLHEQIKTAQHLGDEKRLNMLIEEFHNLIKTR